MQWLFGLDWGTMFTPDIPVMEIIIRGTVVYLALFLILRVILKRQCGTLGVTDLLVISLISNAMQNAMASNYRSLPDGILLVLTLIFWDYTLDALAYRYAWFDKIISPKPIMLIKNGRMIINNMRKELITHEDMMCQMRLQGIDEVKNVREAYLEGDGKISIIEFDKKKTQHQNSENLI